MPDRTARINSRKEGGGCSEERNGAAYLSGAGWKQHAQRNRAAPGACRAVFVFRGAFRIARVSAQRLRAQGVEGVHHDHPTRGRQTALMAGIRNEHREGESDKGEDGHGLEYRTHRRFYNPLHRFCDLCLRSPRRGSGVPRLRPTRQRYPHQKRTLPSSWMWDAELGLATRAEGQFVVLDLLWTICET